MTAADRDRRGVVVLSPFDGFHLGHRRLVEMARQIAGRQRPLTALVVDDLRTADRLMPIAARCFECVAVGASGAVSVQIEPSDVVHAVATVRAALDELRPEIVVVACPPDVSQMPYPRIRQVVAATGIEVFEAPRALLGDGTIVTSDVIRQALADGDVARATEALGRPFTISAEVVHGAGLGRTIGFPTANLAHTDGLVHPRNGVYDAIVTLDDGTSYDAAVNIGVRPTVETDGHPLVESHLLDFDGDLYGRTITVGFRKFLRPERRFEGIDQLVEQLHRDVEQVRPRP